ncbi:MAG: hypothetical protein HKN40_01635 [Winogradskyella sp.]|uniref:hypothetical protein n=1 Tax=Winogradskyella sp. TaxID=1883156 RepID=UPI0017AA19BD|nr:hypothetical protein [Winogradskyella sp.]
MNVNIRIPTTLNEITLGQYQEYAKLQDLTETDLQLKTIEIFCNVPEVVVRNMKATDIVEICGIINNMFDTKHQLISMFKMNGVEYGFIPSLEDMSFGEYVDLDTFIGDNDNLHRAVNVLYRPIEHRKGNRYTIKEYEPNTSEIAKDMPLDAVLGAVVFFYNLGKDLSLVMLNSLDKKNEQTLAEYLTSQPNGGGTIQSMDYLTEILQNLNISLN